MKKLLKLRNDIARHQAIYYNGGENPVDDSVYDSWIRELKQLSPDDPLLKAVGAPVPPDSALQKVKHKHHMGSLNNAMTEDEFSDWYQGVYDKLSALEALPASHGQAMPHAPSLNVSFKMDGASAELVYENGELVQASTRGDGCLDGSTLLEFEDGTKRSIQDIVTGRVQGKVKCYDTAAGSTVYREVLEFFENGESEDWYEVSGVTAKGDTATLRITGAHLVWVPGKGYTEVRNLVEGDEVVFKA